MRPIPRRWPGACRGRGSRQDAHTIARDLESARDQRVDELGTKKSKTIDPDGGIHEERELVADHCGLAAMPGQLRGQLATNRAKRPLPPLDLVQQRCDRCARAQMATNME